MIDRIKSTLLRKITLEKRSALWQWCYDHISSVEFNEANLENMANNDLTWGIFGGTGSELNKQTLLRLAEVVGVSGLSHYEGATKTLSSVDLSSQTESIILKEIEKGIGFPISLPPFIGGRTINTTNYGIITDRHCYYLWILKRIVDLCPDRNSRILEIGAGIGILGYYLDKLGYKNYTTIDLAYSNAIQGYFLWRNLPDRIITLSDEDSSPDSIRLSHASDFKNLESNQYDIMINIDGLTEMEESQACQYVNSSCAPILLSINHEANAYRVIDICRRKKLYRHPFWLRSGYVEELYGTLI